MGTTQTTIYDYILIASIILGIILVYFFISIISQQRINMSLRRRNTLQEISGLEKERARIAADLHDEMGPLLSAVKMKINSFDLQDPRERVELEKTNGHIDDIIRRMREISFDLMPGTLLKKGLVKALTEYALFIEKERNLKVHFTHRVESVLEQDKSVNLYRIVQEVVHNSVRHSGASEITIDLTTREDKLILYLSDNGCGFDHKQALTAGKGIGLRSIINRAQIAGGRSSVASLPGKGASYLFEIPI